MIINNKASGHYLFIEANEPVVEDFEFCLKARFIGQMIVVVFLVFKETVAIFSFLMVIPSLCVCLIVPVCAH